MVTCKACGKPIKNYIDAEIFEGMHWLCFHLIFEHDDFDPDEACHDPSCPWNKITGESFHIIHSYSDLKFLSTDKKSGIYLSKKSLERTRLPSIEFELNVIDELIRDYNDTIWIELEHLEEFYNGLILISKDGRGKASLRSMSPEDLIVQISNIDRSGHFTIEYSISKSKYLNNRIKEVKYSSSFEIDIILIDKFIVSISKLLNLFK